MTLTSFCMCVCVCVRVCTCRERERERHTHTFAIQIGIVDNAEWGKYIQHPKNMEVVFLHPPFYFYQAVTLGERETPCVLFVCSKRRSKHEGLVYGPSTDCHGRAAPLRLSIR